MSVTTAVKVVVALLQHSTNVLPTQANLPYASYSQPPLDLYALQTNSALCVTILDLFLDALRQLPPLSLSEAHSSRHESLFLVLLAVKNTNASMDRL